MLRRVCRSWRAVLRHSYADLRVIAARGPGAGSWLACFKAGLASVGIR